MAKMKHKVEYSKREQKKLKAICAWCGKKIRSGGTAYTVDGTFAPEADFSDQEGTFIPVHILTADKVLPMFVTPSWSPIKQMGKDFVYITCSEECGKSLKMALADDKKTTELINRIFSSD